MPHTQDGAERYVATEPLGEGGTAEVWRAWDRHAETWCALKVLFERFARKRASRQRFVDEGRTVMRLRHRNVIDAWDLVDDAVRPFLVMEIAEGGSLKDWVDRHGSMAPRLAVDVAIQISKGIGAAHALGVVHRDIKPHNILLSRRGLCKVTDFGIAQIVREDGTASVPDWTQTLQTSAGQAVGTLGYMAPEQRTDGYLADVRTDVYGIGATLYTLLTGRVVTNLFIAERDPELVEGIPGELVPVLMQATAYKPDSRYETVRELAKALFELRDRLPDLPAHTPGLAPDLPPEPVGPYEATRNTGPSHASISTSTSGGGPHAPRALERPSGSDSRSSSPPTATPTSARQRSGLVLSHERDPEEFGVHDVPTARTRPLIVLGALVGILMGLITLDIIWVNAARSGCMRANRAFAATVAQHAPAVEALADNVVEARYQTLMRNLRPEDAAWVGNTYLEALRRAAANLDSERTKVNGLVVRRAVSSVEKRHHHLLEELATWDARAHQFGLAVGLGLTRGPESPPES